MREAPVPAQQPQASEATRLPPPDVDSRRASHRVGAPAQGPSQAVGVDDGGSSPPSRGAPEAKSSDQLVGSCRSRSALRAEAADLPLTTSFTPRGGRQQGGRPPKEGLDASLLVGSLRGRAAFAALRAEGRRVRRGAVTVTWAPGDPAEPPRVAYAVGRRAGGAVVRNRIRRRLRSIIRDARAELVPGAYLVGAGADAATLPYGELRTTVCEALRAVTARPGGAV